MPDFVNNLLATFAVELAGSASAAAAEVVGHSGALAGALTYLAQEPDIGPEQLRAPLGLSQPASVRVVQQLVDLGYATRAADPDDGRRVRVRLSEEGEKLAGSVLAAREAATATALDALSAAEQRALAGLVSKMLATMTFGRSDAERICRLCDLRVCPEDRCPVGIAAEQHEASR